MIIIQGSSRSNGDTAKFINYILKKKNCEYVDLLQYSIGHFDYDFKNKDDDFLPLIEKLIMDYDHFLFASPVYWYSMSGVMKVFLDRFSDLLIADKPVGRQLRGKSMSVLSVSGQDDVSESFYLPFRMTADYLGMKYKGECHAFGESENPNEIVKTRMEKFLASI